MKSPGLTCGIDWAEAHHDVALVDQDGTTVAKRRVSADLPGLTALLELIAEYGGDPEQTPVAIETDKNLFVVALAAAGFTVYPINPRALARYRERHGQAGAKSDPADAVALANVLRTDRHVHRPLPAISDQGLAVKALARQHQEAVWSLHQMISRLRAVLLEFYPQAVKAFPKMKHHAATAILTAAPTPAAAQRLTRRKIETILVRCGRRNDPSLVEQIFSDLTSPALRQPEPVERSLGITVQGQLKIIVAMREAVDELGAALAAAFDTHEMAPILSSAPGLGPVLAARVLAEIGDDPARFASAAGLCQRRLKTDPFSLVES